jgi:hypothetical protein
LEEMAAGGGGGGGSCKASVKTAMFSSFVLLDAKLTLFAWVRERNERAVKLFDPRRTCSVGDPSTVSESSNSVFPRFRGEGVAMIF